MVWQGKDFLRNNQETEMLWKQHFLGASLKRGGIFKQQP